MIGSRRGRRGSHVQVATPRTTGSPPRRTTAPQPKLRNTPGATIARDNADEDRDRKVEALASVSPWRVSEGGLEPKPRENDATVATERPRGPRDPVLTTNLGVARHRVRDGRIPADSAGTPPELRSGRQVDRPTFNGTIIETGTDSYRLASTRARAEESAKAS